MPQRPNRKASDLVRCAMCRRLTQRKTAKKLNGSWYGPTCKAKAIQEAASFETNERGYLGWTR